MIHYNDTEQSPTYLITLWDLLLTNNEYKHNDLKWNIMDKHFGFGWCIVNKTKHTTLLYTLAIVTIEAIMVAKLY